MITVPKAKVWIDEQIHEFLNKLGTNLRIADLGVNAKQSDVTKVKQLIFEKMEKFK